MRAGNCEVQIEIAGQRVPPSFALVPNDIRTMAVNLIETCGQKADKSQMGSNDQYIGGFTFGSLHNMIGWLTSEDGDLDKPMRECGRLPPVQPSAFLVAFSISIFQAAYAAAKPLVQLIESIY